MWIHPQIHTDAAGAGSCSCIVYVSLTCWCYLTGVLRPAVNEGAPPAAECHTALLFDDSITLGSIVGFKLDATYGTTVGTPLGVTLGALGIDDGITLGCTLVVGAPVDALH